MPNSYYTEKLLGLQEVSIKKINNTKENHEIFIEQPRKQCVCPVSGNLPHNTITLTKTPQAAWWGGGTELRNFITIRFPAGGYHIA